MWAKRYKWKEKAEVIENIDVTEFQSFNLIITN